MQKFHAMFVVTSQVENIMELSVVMVVHVSLSEVFVEDPIIHALVSWLLFLMIHEL
jgi:hypothetical protein